MTPKKAKEKRILVLTPVRDSCAPLGEYYILADSMGFAFEFDAKNNTLRGVIGDRPAAILLGDEILKLLIKRQTDLVDGLNALTAVELGALKAQYGGARANEFDLLLSRYFEEVKKFSETIRRDRFCGISYKRFAEWTERDRVSMDEEANQMLRRRLRSVSVKRLWHRIRRAGTNLRNKLAHGEGLQGPESVRHLSIEIGELLNKRGPSLSDGINALNTVMLTAIEATHGREKANEYDSINAWFAEELVGRFSGGRVQ